jgi:uncharacterized RDD family membrane protein YckC
VSDAPPPPPPPPPPPAGDAGYGYAQQAAPYVLASKGKRLGGFLLDALLVVVTLVIGWIIWWVILWKQGQSPAKSILKMRVYKLDAGRAANTGEMAIRELVGKWLLNFIPFWTIVSGIIIIADEKSQGLWDKIAGTVVIDDPDGRFRPPGV